MNTKNNSSKNPREAAQQSHQGKFNSDSDLNPRGKTSARSSSQLPDRTRNQLSGSSPNK